MWGGRNNAVACDTLSCFDTKTLEWSTPTITGNPPYAKDGHSACIIENKMFIFGGFEYLTDQYSQEVHYLNLDTLQWSFIVATGTPPSHRDFHTTVAIGNRMYVFGGRGDLNSPYNSHEEVYCPEVYYLDITEEKWIATKPTGTWPEGRRSHSACKCTNHDLRLVFGEMLLFNSQSFTGYHNGFMYIFGGYNGNTKAHFNDIYRYSILDNHWEFINVLGSVPCKRRRQACLLYDDKVYLFGGTR